MWPGISLYFIGLAYANSCTGDGFAGKQILVLRYLKSFINTNLVCNKCMLRGLLDQKVA